MDISKTGSQKAPRLSCFVGECAGDSYLLIGDAHRKSGVIILFSLLSPVESCNVLRYLSSYIIHIRRGVVRCNRKNGAIRNGAISHRINDLDCEF